ncbi:MAG TPA: cation:proton antiporter [Gemmataceae bacterium]|nr:cation:proton antiporter [Gemmataceae bacterium]
MRSILLYVGLLVGTLALFWVINQAGQELVAPEPTVEPATAVPAQLGRIDPLFHVLLTLAAVIALGWVLSRLFRYAGQPPVIGEVVAGIALGPSLLGRISPDAMAFLLPAPAAPYLSVVAQIGVILFMFVIGLELNPGLLRNRLPATIVVSHTGILIPFALGLIFALWLYPLLSSREVPFTNFALFFGIAMAITAFPVLARILTDRGVQTTAIGVTALTCAALEDATAWCLLAFVVGVAKSQSGEALRVIGLTVAFIAFMALVVRPVAVRLNAYAEAKNYRRGAVAVVFVALLLSALATEWIGIHALFGAFLLGAIIPHDSALARDFTHKLEDLVTVLLLPAYFALTGMRTQVGLLAGWNEWLICLAIIAAATAGKFGGTILGARTVGMPWRDSATLGILMNTRGLMELIVLNIGLDLKIISPTLFAMMVLMALATTVATTPLLHLTGLLPTCDPQPDSPVNPLDLARKSCPV